MKHISKRGIGVAAAVVLAATVAGIPAATAGSGDENSAEGSARFGANERVRLDVEGDRDEAEGTWRFTDGTSTAYGTPLCVTGTEDGPGETVAIGLWFRRSNFPGGSVFAQGKFGIHYVQDKSGPDASFFDAETIAVNCPTQGFLLTSIPALVNATSGDYDVDVED